MDILFKFILCFPVNSPQVNVHGVATVSGTGTITKVQVTLECRARGQPSPDIKWTNGTRDLKNQASPLTHTDGSTSLNSDFQVPLSQFIFQSNCQKKTQSSRVVRCSWLSYKCIASYAETHGGARKSAHALLGVDLSMYSPFMYVLQMRYAWRRKKKLPAVCKFKTVNDI